EQNYLILNREEASSSPHRINATREEKRDENLVRQVVRRSVRSCRNAKPQLCAHTCHYAAPARRLRRLPRLEDLRAQVRPAHLPAGPGARPHLAPRRRPHGLGLGGL